MADFKPSLPYATPIHLLIPTYQKIKGVGDKIWPETGILIFCSFKTYAGTDANTNDVYSVIDTAKIETWYRPDIKADCRIKNLLSGKTYEILGAPENVEMRNQFCVFKVKAVEGDA